MSGFELAGQWPPQTLQAVSPRLRASFRVIVVADFAYRQSDLWYFLPEGVTQTEILLSSSGSFGCGDGSGAGGGSGIEPATWPIENNARQSRNMCSRMF